MQCRNDPDEKHNERMKDSAARSSDAVLFRYPSPPPPFEVVIYTMSSAMASPTAPVKTEPLPKSRMAEFWRVGGDCVVAGASVSLGSTGTYVTAVTVTTSPSGDVVV
jgi:hypothetical protein